MVLLCLDNICCFQQEFVTMVTDLISSFCSAVHCVFISHLSGLIMVVFACLALFGFTSELLMSWIFIFFVKIQDIL